ncbi:triose-phosphate isomerase [Siculibacillus lacustris]|uniref:Triosephosphate isomerase n=1 Tax=Siculibacillus lacustris TaxID=1549641 RepID=A0A4Q9VQB6_9HYPH|nr:triose-phosphate isomerase [Siculibacillus lacustris]TBW37036.1 triose-phosphate isomerase [Siculibacillus lacustris]
MKPLVAGNWKMNGVAASVAELDAMIAGHDAASRAVVDLAICPPAVLIAAFAPRSGPIAIGGQDCHAKVSGAHTGDIAAEQLKDAGATMVIVGHSERRTDHGETDEIVRAKAEAAQRAGLVAIVCVGETEAERKSGRALYVVGTQVDGSMPASATAESLVVAYEPVWAIGTGLVPTAADVAEVHGFIRAKLVALYGPVGESVRILYGGSVKPSNAKELLSVKNVNGALVGGASLKATDFLAIAAAYR